MIALRLLYKRWTRFNGQKDFFLNLLRPVQWLLHIRTFWNSATENLWVSPINGLVKLRLSFADGTSQAIAVSNCTSTTSIASCVQVQVVTHTLSIVLVQGSGSPAWWRLGHILIKPNVYNKLKVLSNGPGNPGHDSASVWSLNFREKLRIEKSPSDHISNNTVRVLLGHDKIISKFFISVILASFDGSWFG